MVPVLKDRMDAQCTAFATLKVKHMKKLVLKIHGGNSNNEVYFNISISLP